MKKGNTLLLAKIIRKHRKKAENIEANSRSSGNHENAVFQAGKATALELLAVEFAKNAKTNRVKFLKLCGFCELVED